MGLQVAPRGGTNGLYMTVASSMAHTTVLCTLLPEGEDTADDLLTEAIALDCHGAIDVDPDNTVGTTGWAVQFAVEIL